MIKEILNNVMNDRRIRKEIDKFEYLEWVIDQHDKR